MENFSTLLYVLFLLLYMALCTTSAVLNIDHTRVTTECLKMVLHQAMLEKPVQIGPARLKLFDRYKFK